MSVGDGAGMGVSVGGDVRVGVSVVDSERVDVAAEGGGNVAASVTGVWLARLQLVNSNMVITGNEKRTAFLFII